MNSKMACFTMFAFGLGMGSSVTYKVVKKKFEKVAQEEINSVKEVFSVRKTEVKSKNEPDQNIRVSNEKEESTDMKEYQEEVSKYDYTKYSSEKSEEKKHTDDLLKKNDIPYVIAPEEFGEFDDYEEVSLIHYENGILTDDMDEPVEDIESTVGLDYFEHFGEYEDDSVYVRNDRLKCDFEILRDSDNYDGSNENS